MNLIGKIFLGLGITATAVGIGYAIHRSIRSKKEDDFDINIGTVDFTGRKVPYSISVKGKNQPELSSTASWRADLVGKGEVNGYGNKRNKFGEVHLPNGLIIFTRSLGTDKTAKIIDFNSKTVKDFKGNVSNALAGATQTITNLFG